MTSPAIPAPSITGLGLRLRPWYEGDLRTMVELFDHPEFATWTPLASPFDLDAARAYLDKSRTNRESGRVLQFAVTTDGRTPLGEVLYVPRPDETPRAVEIAYGIGPRHRGRGLANRAVRLMVEHARQTDPSARVVLRIAEDNLASQGVARSAGFVLTDEDLVTRECPGRSPALLRTWSHQPGAS
ncbi:N-acetyltransferase [Actinomadura logoneensis]|uniref:N-acetyltransferase n=1 Tax=Actinomadura logoneensis TaxID=2293572 RepID=A0A372JAI1_9ACTN|nr:GNAT family N-acetyltransferase [Actinomadura logoneensis]RFU36826.1 N-acetyltransferase [Actinomadura logoneensis]